jgi:hypothetical protein
MPMEKVRSVECMTMYEAGSAAMKDGRRTKTATVDRHPSTSEPTAMEGCAAAAETTAVEAAATTAEAATTAAAMTHFGRETVGCEFY